MHFNGAAVTRDSQPKQMIAIAIFQLCTLLAQVLKHEHIPCHFDVQYIIILMQLSLAHLYVYKRTVHDVKNNRLHVVHIIFTLCLRIQCRYRHRNLSVIVLLSPYKIRGIVIQSCAHFRAKPRPFRSFLRQITSPTYLIDPFSNEFSSKAF